MKKYISILSVFLIAVLVLTGCGSAAIPLAYDSMIPEGGIQDDGQYNKDLFYRNDALWAQPDPFILYITDEDSTEYGYYYLYATLAGCSSRSRHLLFPGAGNGCLQSPVLGTGNDL